MAFALLAAVIAAPAFGQTSGTVQPGEAKPAQPAPPQPAVEWTISPRFWYLFGTAGVNRPANSLNFSTNTQFEFPMAGAALSARFLSLPETTFIFTALYGETGVTNNQSSLAPIFAPQFGNGFQSSNISSSTHVNRYDFEFLDQTAIPESNWAWIAGVRLEHDSQHTMSISQSAETFATISAHLPNPITMFSGAGSNLGSLKGGIAGSVPLNAAGDFRLFGNIMVLGGIFNVSQSNGLTTNSGIIGPDIRIGLQYVLSPGVTFDARYRGMFEFLTNVSARTGQEKYAINQGPMVGINFKF